MRCAECGATRQLVATHADPGSPGSIYSVAFSPDGSMLAAADTNGNIYLWDAG
jgi:WD40 repeat protein